MRDAVARVLRMLLEVIDARRPGAQLGGVAAGSVARYVRAARLAGCPARVSRLVSLRVCRPTEHAAEAAAVVVINRRVRAVGSVRARTARVALRRTAHPVAGLSPPPRPWRCGQLGGLWMNRPPRACAGHDRDMLMDSGDPTSPSGAAPRPSVTELLVRVAAERGIDFEPAPEVVLDALLGLTQAVQIALVLGYCGPAAI
jgi:hypothetical protein